MRVHDWLKQAEKFAADNSPAILTGLGVTGTVATAYLTGKATFKAAEIINDEKSIEKHPDAKLFIKSFWKLYIPAIGMGITTCACIIMANRIGTRRAAAMAAAYSISERAFEEYRVKVKEKLGETKEEKVRAEIAQERVDKDPVGTHEVVVTGGGEVLCYDMYTGRYFNSDMETIKKAQNDLNYKVLNDFYASLSDFYDLIGLNRTTTSDEVGWNSDKLLEIHFSTIMSEDQRPCIAIDFAVAPIRDYFRVH